MSTFDKYRIADIIAKTRAFYDTPSTGCALIKVKGIATLHSPELCLTDYSFPNDVHRYMDDRARRTIARWEKRAQIKDDSIPVDGPWYGIAEHSAFLGGRVEFNSDTSWHHAFLDSPEELFKLSLDENNVSFRIVIDGIAYMREKYSDSFLPMVRGASGAMEIANALRGNDFFYDFYEEPEALHKLLDYCADALVWYYEKQLAAAGDVYGGVVTGFGEWLPGHSLGHVSEDTSTMISRAQFDEFAAPRTSRVYSQYDSVFLHMHALSERTLPSVAALPKLRLMELSSDPNTDRAVAVWARNRDVMGGVIPVLRLTRDEILTNMDMLKSQKTVLWYDAVSIEDAEDMCALISRELPVGR